MPSQKTTHSKTYHHGDLKNTLIQAGLAILAAEGYAALSLRKVARHAGVSHTAPYNHFANKEALIGAIAAEGFNRLAQAMMVAITPFPDDPQRQLSEMGWGYVQFALANPDHLRVMFLDISGGMALGQLPEHVDPFVILLRTMQACQAAGVVVAGDSMQLAFTAWSMVHGTAVLLSNLPLPPQVDRASTVEQMARANIQYLLAGLMK